MSKVNVDKVLEVRDLVVAYGSKIIIDHISFDVARKEVTAILGPNGSGKSTMIKAILGLIPIKSGSVKVLGQDVSKVLDKIGYLPQGFQFDRSFPITVREFLAFSLKKGRSLKIIEEKLTEVGMSAYKDALLGTLSGGQLQRVLIARAILNNPELLILDEPEAGIDIEAEKNFYQLILHLNNQHNITPIFISHEVDLVYDFAKQVICLNKSLVCQGRPRKVLTPEKLEELYGGGLSHHQHIHKEKSGQETHSVHEHGTGQHQHGQHKHK